MDSDKNEPGWRFPRFDLNFIFLSSLHHRLNKLRAELWALAKVSHHTRAYRNGKRRHSTNTKTIEQWCLVLQQLESRFLYEASLSQQEKEW
jgi:hypothetical protein